MPLKGTSYPHLSIGKYNKIYAAYSYKQHKVIILIINNV